MRSMGSDPSFRSMVQKKKKKKEVNYEPVKKTWSGDKEGGGELS